MDNTRSRPIPSTALATPCSPPGSRWSGVFIALVVSGCPVPYGPFKDGGPGAVTDQNHPYFPIGLDSTHPATRSGPITCESCHPSDTSSFVTFTCLSCHPHRQAGFDADAGTGGMDEAHAGIAGYRYESRSCLDCHPTGMAGELSRSAHTYFPIAAGTRHQDVGCSECHTTPSRANVTCTGCHRDNNHDSQFDHDVAPMAAVHGTDMAVLGYAWDTGACLKCHPASDVPGLLDHRAKFPIDAGTVHGTSTCADCHPSRLDHRQVACITCHEQKDDGAGRGPRPVHGRERMSEGHHDGGIPGYAWESGSCYLCHQRSQVPGDLDHTQLFPIGPGSKHEVGSTTEDTPAVTIGCPTCHVAAFGSGADGGPDPGGGDLLNIDCTGCHVHAQDVMLPTHGKFIDYQWQSSACIFCHFGGAQRLNHVYFPTGVGTSHEMGKAVDDPPVTVACRSCHVSKVQRKLLSCTGCHRHDSTHSTADHGVQMAAHGYQYDPGACFGCHPTSQIPGIFDHEPIWKLQPPSGNGKHVLLRCGDCHANKVDRRGSLTCTACHQPTSFTDLRDAHGEARMAQVHVGYSDYLWSPIICIGCHVDGTKDAALLHLNHTWFPITAQDKHRVSADGSTGISCQSCHPVANEFSAATVACTGCHVVSSDVDGGVHSQSVMANQHSGVDSYVWASAACLDCHPNSEPMGNFVHSRFPITSGTKHTGLRCSDCHLGSGPKTDVTQLACFGCHAALVNKSPTVGQIHNGVPNYTADSPACFNCHPHSEPVGPMDHTRLFPVAVGDKHATAAYLASMKTNDTTCTACHASRTDRTREFCASCHTALVTPAPPIPAHSKMQKSMDSTAYTSDGCKKCHADPTPVYRLSGHPDPGYDHKGATCQNCHQDMRSDKPYAIDFSKEACSCSSSKCHDSNTDKHCR